MTTPFKRYLDCDNQDVLMSEYGSETDDTRKQCLLDNRIISACRVYFIVALINGTFVIITTVMFTCIALLGAAEPYYYINSIPLPQDRRKLVMRWNRNTLQKRSIFGTTLGAIGHFIISTNVLISQAFRTEEICDIYIWSVSIGFYTWFFALFWRAYRLRFLIRLNELKTRYSSFARNDNVTTTASPLQGASNGDAALRWFIENKDCKRIDISRPLTIYIGFLVVLVVVFCFIEILLFHNPASGVTCKDVWGLYLMAGFTLFFIAVLAPITFWRLHRFKDSYGIRNEILIDIAVGIPCFIMAIIWNTVLGRSSVPSTYRHYRLFFAPRNWLFVFTTTGHIISVVVPLLQLTYREQKFRRGQSTRVEPNQADAPMDDTLQQTPSTLERLLSKPDAVDAMLQLAVKDFSSENVLFYNQYLKLVDKVQEYDEYGQISRRCSWARSSPTLAMNMRARDNSRSSSEEYVVSSSSMNDTSRQDIIHTSMKGELVRVFVDLYCTYIAEGSPLQVNVSHEARKELDRVFGKIRHEENPSWMTPWSVVATHVSTGGITNSPRWCWGSQSMFPAAPSPAEEQAVQEPKDEEDEEEEEEEVNLALFEKVRNEVFWNIFASVFPKYVCEVKKSRVN